MPLEAVVSIKLKQIKDLPKKIDGRPHPYALVTVGGHRFGRSRKILDTSPFDLTAEPEPWEIDVVVRAGESIPIRMELHDDHGDESKPILTLSAAVASPWNDGEVVLGSSPKLVLEVTTTRARVARGAIRAKRSPTAKSSSAVVRVRRAAALEFTEIQGLYKPGHLPGLLPGGRAPRLAEASIGYISDDNRGRVYINHDLRGRWKKGQQLIQLEVKLTLNGVKPPAGAKVKWTVTDPNDPTNDDPKFHQEAGRYVDPSDYNSSGEHIGAHGNDNPRAFSEAGGSLSDIYNRRPPWQAVSGFSISDKADMEAKTAIVKGVSKVKLHCPNVGGTNLIVRAELDPPVPFPVLPAISGVMTMWKRIDVEVVRMDDALELKPFFGNISDSYVPACVQLDFQPERVLPAGRDSKDHMAPDDDSESARSAAWIKRVFKNRKRPGWFFIGAAKRASVPPSSAPISPLFDSDDAKTDYEFGFDNDGDFIDINKSLDASNPAQKVAAVALNWKLGSKKNRMFFGVWMQETPTTGSFAGTGTRLKLLQHDIQNRFTGHDSDGSLAHAHAKELEFYPTNTVDSSSRSSIGPGYKTPVSGANKARLRVAGRRPGETAGISPSIDAGGKSFFAGQTIIFTHFPPFVDKSSTPPSPTQRFKDEVANTVVHEFAHAFGMPHKCGNWDHQLPRKTSCCMNYWDHWLIKPGTINKLDPNTDNVMGTQLCGRHLMEIRRVHLDKNKGLRWK